MSLKLPTTIIKTSSLPLKNHSKQTHNKNINPFTSTIAKQNLYKSSNPPKQTKPEEEKQKQDHHKIINRRNLLLGLGTLYRTAATFTNQDLISIAAHNNQSSHQTLPQILEKKTIRFLVERPKKLKTKSKKIKPVEVLVIDGIEIHHNGPVKFDVYVAKAHNDVVGQDLGEFAGSLVNFPFSRVGVEEEVQSKGSMEMGISGLVREIEAQDCEKVAVSLVPRFGRIVIGGLHIEECKNFAKNLDDIEVHAPTAPHRTATFA